MGARSEYPPGTFCWADLSTRDLEGSQQFFAGLLGWEFQGPIATLRGVPVAAVNEQHMHESHWNSYVAVESAAATAERAAQLGATIVEPAFEVAPFGALSLMKDPQGAVFCVWEAGDHVGAGLVNEPGALTWNHLDTSDLEAAQAFYGDLFGWTWNEGVCLVGDRMNGSAEQIYDPPAWWPYFAVEDLERAQAQVTELGGLVLEAPKPAGPGHFITIADPSAAVVCLYAGEMED